LASKRIKKISTEIYKRAEIHIRKEKKTYFTKDKKKLRIIAYLVSLDKRATENKIREKAPIPKQEPTDFKKLLRELLAMKWVEGFEPTREDGYEEYTFTEKGRDALNEAKRIVREDNNPLADLEAFEDIQWY